MTVRQFLHGLLLLAVAFMMSGTTGDPDLWGHVRFGQDMLAQKAIRLPDTYSFTADRSWVNHEWLTELLMAIAFNMFGAAGLNLLRIAAIGCALGIVWGASTELGGGQRTLVVAACAVGIYMRAHPIRPQVFSSMLFAVLLLLLQRADARRSLRPLVWVPLVMAAWVNLHGGWVVGLGYFGLWCVTRATASTTHNRVRLAAALLAALGSTLLNPYGVQMWEFLAGTVRFGRPMIADWQPLYTLPLLLWMSWMASFAVLAVTAAHARTRADWANVASAAAVGLAAVRVSRIDAFFALAAAFAAISVLAKAGVAVDLRTQARRVPGLSAAFAVCAAAAAVALVPRIATVRVPDHLMPDADVAAYARDQRLTGHVLTWFNWGEYLIWHFGPDLKVSMDGRRETVYSADVVDAHMRFYAGASDQWRYADALNADYVWIPRQLPVVRELQLHGWRPLCQGDLSILLTRKDHARQCSPQPAPRSRSFPEL